LIANRADRRTLIERKAKLIASRAVLRKIAVAQGDKVGGNVEITGNCRMNDGRGQKQQQTARRRRCRSFYRGNAETRI